MTKATKQHAIKFVSNGISSRVQLFVHFMSKAFTVLLLGKTELTFNTKL